MQPSKLVYSIRTERKISQADLARGLISVSELSRFENGEKELPYSIIEALVQRLGKSCDKFSIRISPEEYQLLFFRQIMAHGLSGKKNIAEQLCIKYENTIDMECSVHHQFLLMIRGCMAFLFDRDIATGIYLLKEALSCTKAEWSNDKTASLLISTQDIQIMLLLAYLLIEAEQISDAHPLLRYLEKRIRSDSTDEEEYSRLYPRLCYLLAKETVKEGNMQLVRDYLYAGKRCLIENGLLTLVPEYLEMEILCGENPDTARIQRESFLFAYEMAGCFRQENDFIQLVLMNQHHEIVLTHELIRDTRKHKNNSQDELSWEICAKETLSRIESGKRSPHARNRQRLFDRLELQQVVYQNMETDDYCLMEKDRLLRREISRKNLAEAEKIFKDIRSGLDLSLPVNRQYVGHNEIIFQVEDNLITYDKAIIHLENLLRITMKDYEGKPYRAPTMNEFSILMQMSAYHGVKERYHDAIALLEDLIKLYEKSSVQDELRARNSYLIYNNLVGYYAVTGELDKAELYAMKGLQLSYKTRRGDMMSTIMGNLAYTFSRKEQETRFEKTREAARHMLIFYQRFADAATVKKIEKCS